MDEADVRMSAHYDYDLRRRVTTGDRHICDTCKRKRHEKFMQMVRHPYDRKEVLTTNFALPYWRCAGGCKDARNSGGRQRGDRQIVQQDHGGQ